MVELFSAGGVVIGPLRDEDLASTLEVYRQSEDFLSLGPVPRASLEMVKTDIEASRKAHGVFCGIWSDKDDQIGVLDFIPEARRGVTILVLLMISREHRNRGLGSSIVTGLESYLKKTYGTKLVESGVQANNEAGIRFWKRCGFQLAAQPRAMGDGTTAFEMRKRI